MTRAMALIAKLAHLAPGMTRREWADVALDAARRAGLDAEDLETLRTSLHDAQRAERGQRRRSIRSKFRVGDPVRYRDDPDSPIATVEEYRPNLVPREVDILWATAAGLQYTRTVPADLLEIAPEERAVSRGRRRARR